MCLSLQESAETRVCRGRVSTGATRTPTTAPAADVPRASGASTATRWHHLSTVQRHVTIYFKVFANFGGAVSQW